MHESHHVLQLVSEPISAARLIKRRSAPNSAAESLIKQPAVEQKVRGKFWCFHFDRAQEPIPPIARFLECSFDVRGIAKASNESTRFFFVVRLAEKESHLGGVSWFNFDYDLDGRARVEAGTNVAGQSFVLHRGRIAQRVVTPDERRAISGEGSRRWIRSGKGDAIAKFRVVGIAGKEALALQIPFRNDMHTGFLWIGSEHECGVGGDSQLSSARRIVAQAQTLQAHRLPSGIIYRHETEQPLFDRVAVVFKHCVTLTMS